MGIDILLGYFSSQLMARQISLNTLSQCLLAFVNWSSLSTLRQAVYNSSPTFAFHLHQASRSARHERSGPSQVFPWHVHSLDHMYNVLGSQENFRAFQIPSWTYLNQIFMFKVFFFSFLLPQLESSLKAVVKFSDYH